MSDVTILIFGIISGSIMTFVVLWVTAEFLDIRKKKSIRSRIERDKRIAELEILVFGSAYKKGLSCPEECHDTKSV